MSGYSPKPPLYDRRRLEELVMEQRLKALLQTRKGGSAKKVARVKK